MFLKSLAGAADGSAGTDSGHEDIDLAFGISPDFLSCSTFMGERVGRVDELA